LSAKADANLPTNQRIDPNFYKPLHFAVYNNVGLGIVRKLLSAGADPRAVTGQGHTVLHLIGRSWDMAWSDDSRIELSDYLIHHGGARACLLDEDNVKMTPYSQTKNSHPRLAKYFQEQTRASLITAIVPFIPVPPLVHIIVNYIF